MPITHQVNPTTHFLETHARGVVTAEELEQHLSLEKRNGFIGLDELFDAREATTNLTSDQVRHFVKRTEELATEGHLGALAFVTEDPVAFGMARMYQLLCDGKPVRVGVFRGLEAAGRWLNGSSPQQGPEW